MMFAVSTWSLLPAYTHTPVLIETLQDHADMVAKHGHSHGFAEDLLWALHGHTHDVADHDHSPVVLLRPLSVRLGIVSQSVSRPSTVDHAAIGPSPFERPPRV